MSGLRIPDGIGLVGILLLIILSLSALGVDLDGQAATGSQSEKAGQSLPGLSTASARDFPGDQQNPMLTRDTSGKLFALATVATATPSPTAVPPTVTQSPTPTFTPSPSPTAMSTESFIIIEPDVVRVMPSATPTATPRPLPTPGRPYSATVRVPILMYHYISVPPAGADAYRQDLSVSPEQFRLQMAFLADSGYTTIALYDLSLAIVGQYDLPEKPVIITLDDGYRDNYDNAFPVLKDYGHTATIFLATEFIDRGDPSYLTWDMVNEMAAAGIFFEPHSKNHLDMRERDHAFLVYEILGSRETIEAHIGYQPRYFAYPGGRYDEDVIIVLQELDFWGALTTAGGRWHGFNDRYEWTRLRVRNTTSMEDFIDLLE